MQPVSGIAVAARRLSHYADGRPKRGDAVRCLGAQVGRRGLAGYRALLFCLATSAAYRPMIQIAIIVLHVTLSFHMACLRGQSFIELKPKT